MAESLYCWRLYLQKNFTIQHTQTTGPYFFCNHCSQVLLRIKEIALQSVCFPSQQNFCWLAVHLGRIHELDSLLRGFTGGRLRALFYEVRISLRPPFKMSQMFASRNMVNQEIENIGGNRASVQKYPKEQNLAWYQGNVLKLRGESPETSWWGAILWQWCQRPGEKQKHWPGLVDGYPNPDVWDHGEATVRWLSFSYFIHPDIFWLVDMTSEEIW